MRRFSATVGLVAALLFAGTPVQGQDYIGRELESQETVRLTGVSGVQASGTQISVGGFTGDLITAPYPTAPDITLYCIDFYNDILVNPWDANVTTLGADAVEGPGGTMGNTRLGDVAGALERYRQSAFLTSLFSSAQSFYLDQYVNPTTGLTNYGGLREVYSGIHSAIWSIMDSGFPSSYLNSEQAALLQALAQPFITLAQTTDLSGFDFSDFAVLTDVATANDKTAGNQEFLVRTTVTPEPETFILLLSGLFIVAIVARRRQKQFGEEVA